MTRPHPALIDLAAGRPFHLPRQDELEHVFRTACEHRMDGLLWSAVRDTEEGPPAWRRRLAEADVVRTARARNHAATAVELTRELRRRGFEVAVCKGVTIEARWYGRVGERPSRDIDLLAAPDALDRVDEIVSCIQPDHPLGGRVAALMDAGALQVVELQDASGTSIDLHADAFKLGLASDRDALWHHVGPLVLEQGDVLALGPAASLALLLVHLNKDRFRHLLGFADVARILAAQPAAASIAVALLDGEGLGVPARATLSTVVSTLGLQGWSAPRGMQTAVWRAVWRPGIRLRGDEGVRRFRQRHLWLTAMARRPVGQRVRALGRELAPAPELVDYRRPGPGPWWWRLTTGRITDAVRRSRAGWRRRPPGWWRRRRGGAGTREGG